MWIVTNTSEQFMAENRNIENWIIFQTADTTNISKSRAVIRFPAHIREEKLGWNQRKKKTLCLRPSPQAWVMQALVAVSGRPASARGQGCLPSHPPSRQAEQGSGSHRSPGETSTECSSPKQLAPKLRLPDTCWQSSGEAQKLESMPTVQPPSVALCPSARTRKKLGEPHVATH